MPALMTDVQTVVYPDDHNSSKNFNEPILLRWPGGSNERYYQLCVGTEGGKWDIVSAHVGKQKQQLIFVGELPSQIVAIYVQVILLGDNSDGDSVPGEVIRINRQ